jgi:hypothetical protein
MTGLRRILKAYGRMRVGGPKGSITWVWDYAADKPCHEDEMPPGSERWKASERARREAGPS